MAYEPFIPCSTDVVLVILEGGGVSIFCIILVFFI